MSWIFVRIASPEAILTNIHNISYLRVKRKENDFYHSYHIAIFWDSLKRQICFNGKIFGDKFCRKNEIFLYFI